MCEELLFEKFVPKNQRRAILEIMNEDSGSRDNMKALLSGVWERIKKSPKLYDTDGWEHEKIFPVLHYFWGNVDVYVTEIDDSSEEMFGYVNLGNGYGYEAGYIYLEEYFSAVPLLELDLYMDKKSIAEIIDKK